MANKLKKINVWRPMSTWKNYETLADPIKIFQNENGHGVNRSLRLHTARITVDANEFHHFVSATGKWAGVSDIVLNPPLIEHARGVEKTGWPNGLLNRSDLVLIYITYGSRVRRSHSLAEMRDRLRSVKNTLVATNPESGQAQHYCYPLVATKWAI